MHVLTDSRRLHKNILQVIKAAFTVIIRATGGGCGAASHADGFRIGQTQHAALREIRGKGDVQQPALAFGFDVWHAFDLRFGAILRDFPKRTCAFGHQITGAVRKHVDTPRIFQTRGDGRDLRGYPAVRQRRAGLFGKGGFKACVSVAPFPRIGEGRDGG